MAKGEIKSGDPGRVRASSSMSPKAISPGRRRAEAEGGGENFTGRGPSVFHEARACPPALDYDAAHGVPANHPTARNAASNMRDPRAARARPGPGDRRQNDGSAGISFPNFKSGK